MSGFPSQYDLRNLPDPRGLFDLGEIVGTGTYGEVFKATHRRTGEQTAIKVLELVEDELEEIKVEIEVLRKYANHTNITSFYGAYCVKDRKSGEDKLWVAMEYCGGGSITDLAKKMEPRRVPELAVRYVLRDTVRALVYLHDHGIVHRDIKGQNILMTDAGSVRLIDFGVSAEMAPGQTKRNTFIGTPYWMAPEVIATDQQTDAWYDQRSDVWSLGITAIEIAQTEPPLADLHPMRALFEIPRNKSPVLKEKKKWSHEFSAFVDACLIKDFEYRPTSAALLQHAFLCGFVEEAAITVLVEHLDRYSSKSLLDESIDMMYEDDRSIGQDRARHGSFASDIGLSLVELGGVDADAAKRDTRDTVATTDVDMRHYAGMVSGGDGGDEGEFGFGFDDDDLTSPTTTKIGTAATTNTTTTSPAAPTSVYKRPFPLERQSSAASHRYSSTTAIPGLVGAVGDAKEGAVGVRRSVVEDGRHNPGHPNSSATRHDHNGGHARTTANPLPSPHHAHNTTTTITTTHGPTTPSSLSTHASRPLSPPSKGGGSAGGWRAPAPIPSSVTDLGDAVVSTRSPHGLSAMPDIRKFKRAFSSDVLCAAFWGMNLIVGTKSGLYLLDRSSDTGKVYPLVSRRRFTQVDVLEELGIMVCTSGKRNDLRVYSLAYFLNKILKGGKKLTDYTTVGNVQRCTCYQLARYQQMQFLTVGHGKMVSVYLWAPQPYHRFMVFKDFHVPHDPSNVHLSVTEEESLRLIFASTRGFYTIDVTSGSLLNLFVPRPAPPGGITPHAILKLPKGAEQDMLLLFNDYCIGIDKLGDVCHDCKVVWDDHPAKVVLAAPITLLGWGQRGIEIRSGLTGRIEGTFKHKRVSKLRYLCAKDNKVFFASNKGSSQCQIYFMVF